MEALMTVDQVAEHLQMNPQVVRRWLQDGRLPGIKIGREWRVDPNDLKAFIESKKRKGV